MIYNKLKHSVFSLCRVYDRIPCTTKQPDQTESPWFPLGKRTIILNYEPTVFPEGWSSRLMFFDQSHFKFTLNQTGDTSRVLDRVFWEPIAVKSHHVSFLTLWNYQLKYIARALCLSDPTETHEDPPTNPHATPIVIILIVWCACYGMA